MTAPLTDVVNVAITATTVNPTQAGFGIGLIVSNKTYSAGSAAVWSERVRTYSNLAAVLVDFPTTQPEYMAAAKYFGQTPCPTTLKIGRAALPATMSWNLTPVAADLHKYHVALNATAASFTSDSSGTVAEVTAGLKTAIDLLAISGLTTTDNTTYLTLAMTQGLFLSVGTMVDGSDRQDPLLGVAQVEADPGIATDLAAIYAEDATWYALITLTNSKAIVDAAAAWCESNKRLYVVQTQDTACINTTLSGTDDVMESTKGNSYVQTGVIFAQKTKDFAAAGWIGKRLVYLPGESTWKFANIAGVTGGTYSSTQRANIKSKNGNFYEDIAGITVAQDGTVASGGFIDFTIYINYLTARLAERIYGKLATNIKIAYTDAGIAIIGAEVKAQLQIDEARGALASGWTVTLPRAVNVSSADRASRTLNGVSFACQYAGAIHSVNIAGVVLP